MARIVVRCPICKATASIDNKKKKMKCPLCNNKTPLTMCEVVVPPEVEEEYHGKWFHNHIFMGVFAILTGILGIDLFVKKRYKKGIISILICWTGASTILGIFRGFDILALEDDQIDDYYKNLK